MLTDKVTVTRTTNFLDKMGVNNRKQKQEKEGRLRGHMHLICGVASPPLSLIHIGGWGVASLLAIGQFSPQPPPFQCLTILFSGFLWWQEERCKLRLLMAAFWRMYFALLCTKESLLIDDLCSHVQRHQSYHLSPSCTSYTCLSITRPSNIGCLN